MNPLVLFTLAILASATAGAQAPPAAKPQAPATQASGNAENGRRLYTAYYCYSCHGTVAQGGAGPRITFRANAAALIKFVRKPTGTMPPYTSKSITEQEITDIHAFLVSIPPSPPARTIALLNQDK